MRVVLIHRYFWPDTPPYAHILRDIAVHLGASGHQVHVLTCQPSYNRSAAGRAPGSERLAAGVEVCRWSVLPDRRSGILKLLNLMLFCTRLLLARRHIADADVVMAASTPPIVVANLVERLTRRHGARFVYHKQDVYPDVVVAPGIMRAGRTASLLRWIDAGTERRAARVVVLSEDMATTVVSRGARSDRVVTINNFDPWPDEVDPTVAYAPTAVRHPQAAANGSLHVAFAGNLGRFQNLETVFAALVLLRDDARVRFDFFGDGPLRRELEAIVSAQQLSGVRVHGYRPAGEVADFLRLEADLGIVSLAPGVIRAAYPSKTMSYLRNGCPVLAVVEADSELARTIIAAGAGLHVDPSDPQALAVALRQVADRPSDLTGAGARARALYRKQFSAERQLGRWEALFESAARSGADR